MWGRGLLVLLGLAVLIQFVPVDRENPPVVSPVDAPAEVEAILERACFDCHSNTTDWPWYSRIAPGSWLMASHVRKGRKNLNFSDWPTFDFEAQDLLFGDIREEVSEGEMPLGSYLLLHPEARLTAAERKTLVVWAGGKP
jgi:hypothetical protein